MNYKPKDKTLPRKQRKAQRKANYLYNKQLKSGKETSK